MKEQFFNFIKKSGLL